MDSALEDMLFFIDAAVDDMCAIVTALGDERSNAAPDLPGANSCYVILSHCLGVINYWGIQLVTGTDVHRDRAAEFVAAGAVDELVDRAQATKGRLRAALASAAAGQATTAQPREPYGASPEFRVRASIAHVLEELAQHHGQMEITRDLLSVQRTLAP